MEAPYLFAIVLATGSSICFAGNRAFASRPLINSDTRVITYITLLTGVIASALAMAILGELRALLLASALVVALFGLVGIVHYAIGRQLSYVAVKNIGANATAPLLSTSVLYSFILSVLFLHEILTYVLVIGTIFILVGVFILEIRSGALIRKGKYRAGLVAAITTAAIFGITPVVISFGLSIYDYYLAAVFISYAVATIIYTLTANTPTIVKSMVKTPSTGLIFFIISGFFASGAQLFRFAALSVAPVVFIVPILSTNPIFTILLTRLVAREFEVFTLRTIISMVLVVIGSALVTIYA